MGLGLENPLVPVLKHPWKNKTTSRKFLNYPRVLSLVNWMPFILNSCPKINPVAMAVTGFILSFWVDRAISPPSSDFSVGPGSWSRVVNNIGQWQEALQSYQAA